MSSIQFAELNLTENTQRPWQIEIKGRDSSLLPKEVYAQTITTKLFRQRLTQQLSHTSSSQNGAAEQVQGGQGVPYERKRIASST